jgi:hypothetical protein
MSDVMTGNAANVTTPLSATVTALSSGPGGVVQVTTASPHLFGSGDTVEVVTGVISGIYGPITVIDANDFTLPGTTFSSTSTGTASNLSLTPQIQLPTDGDQASMQLGLLSGLQAILDRTQHLALRGMQKVYVFNSTTTWTCPPNVYLAFVQIFGGGGGGAGGAAGNDGSTNSQAVGGGGGAGAPPPVGRWVSVTPGTTYTITVGAGGTGGSGGTISGPPGAGGDGAASSLVGGSLDIVGGGGAGGQGAVAAAALANATQLVAVLGGMGVSWASNAQPAGDGPWAVSTSLPIFPASLGGGGHSFANGAGNYLSWSGFPSQTGQPGGLPGLAGSATSSYMGGNGGGGGGGGPLGVGGQGGGGGNGSATAGAIGSVGTAGAANTGAGGGGGGGGGSGGASAGNGAAGEPGGSGQVRIITISGLGTP